LLFQSSKVLFKAVHTAYTHHNMHSHIINDPSRFPPAVF